MPLMTSGDADPNQYPYWNTYIRHMPYDIIYDMYGI